MSARDAAVQCDLADPHCNRIAATAALYDNEIFWTQHTVFRRGRCIPVRDLGVQTESLIDSMDRQVQMSPLGVLAWNDGVMVEDEPFWQLSSAGPCESLASYSWTGEDRPQARGPSGYKLDVPGNETLRPRSWSDDQNLEHHMYNLTLQTRDRACALQEHVHDLKKLASAALMDARQFQVQFDPKNAFDIGSRKNSKLQVVKPGTQSNHNTPSPRLRSKSRSSSATTATTPMGRSSAKDANRLPWLNQMQQTTTGCPTQALGNKILKSNVDPWGPAILTQLPPLKLRDRLAISAYRTPSTSTPRERYSVRAETNHLIRSA